MRKTVLYYCILLVGLAGVVGCGKSSNNDFVEVNTRYIEAMDAYTNDLDKAADADAIANAVNTFTDNMAELIPEMKKMQEKYVEWQDASKIPEDLKPLKEKADRVAEKVPMTFMKLMPYMQDPKVMAAMKRMQETMAKMGQ